MRELFLLTALLACARDRAWASPEEGGTSPAPGRPEGAEAAPPDTAPPTEPEGDGLSESERAAIERALSAAPAPSSPAAAPPAISNPDLSLIFDGAFGYFSDDDPDQRGGHDPNRTGFTFQQLELHAGASVDPFFRFDANIVFAQFGVEVEEAFATTLALPLGLQLRAGQFLTRFGRRNPTHPHAWSFLDQPLVLGKFMGSEGSRGLGLEASWLTPLPWYAELVVSANEAQGECCARSMLGARDTGVHGPGDLLYSLMFKQFWELGPDLGLNFGLSLQLGPNSTGLDNRTLIAGFDLYLRWKPRRHAGRTSVDLTVEGLFRAREVPGRNLRDGGGFAELRWLMSSEWAVALRHELVTGLADDPLDPDWTGLRQRSNLALDFLPSHFSRLRLQLGADRAAWEDAVGWSALLGLEVTIGAHAAHAY
jgi:hypothetical protein